jgi:hypothetical protein
MKRIISISVVVLATYCSLAWAIPTAITYQGTLKQNGIPLSDYKNMTFTLVSPDGTIAYSVLISSRVHVVNGLFSIPLNFNLVVPYTWESINPYIKISVEGQDLKPIEPLSATIYATVSASVIDGAITRQKIDPTSFESAGIGLVPQGAIIMFNGSCPPGWNRFAILDNRFPLGVDPALTVPGTFGGSASHSHSISIDGAHNHGGLTARNNNDRFDGKLGGPDTVPSSGHTHNISTDGAHNHSGSTGSVVWIPPYAAIVFCQKQ